MRIAILYTTFIRPELARITLPTLVKNTDEDTVILVADQGKETDRIKELCEKYPKVKYYRLPFDCGSSIARNFIIKEANKMGIKYLFFSADSIAFTKTYDFKPIIDFLEQDTKRGIVGVDLLGRCSWERDMELIPQKHFHLKLPQTPPVTFQNIVFQKCDIIRNVYLAKVECLLDNFWDEDFKTGVHEDFFWRLKIQKKWEVWWTNYILLKYENCKPVEYIQYRSRLTGEFRKQLQAKYNIQGWVIYDR